MCTTRYVALASPTVIRARMVVGITGVAVMRAPNGFNASAIALAIAAGAPIVPPSAMPLNPPGTVRSGDSRCDANARNLARDWQVVVEQTAGEQLAIGVIL